MSDDKFEFINRARASFLSSPSYLGRTRLLQETLGPGLGISNLIKAVNPVGGLLKVLSQQNSAYTNLLDAIRTPAWMEQAERLGQTSLAFDILEKSRSYNNLFEAARRPVWIEEFERIGNATSAFRNSFASIGAHASHFIQYWRELPERYREALLVMAQHGWYLDMQAPVTLVFDFADEVEAGDLEGAEQAMADHFEDRLPEIKSSLIEQFPHRAEIFKAAFSAVERGEHILAIPVLLAQVDGICRDVAGKYYFIIDRKREKPEVSSFLLQVTSSALGDAIRSPLESVMPIGLSEKKRSADFTGLNRHMVLHGESLDYGQRVNSLKVVSLLNYMAQMFLKETELDDEELDPVDESVVEQVSGEP